jgi:hypothetical protein
LARARPNATIRGLLLLTTPHDTSVDLSFLRTLAGSSLPRAVPIGPAFHLVLAYQAAGYIELEVPPLVRTRSGNGIQPDAVVIRLTPLGLEAVAHQTQQP